MRGGGGGGGLEEAEGGPHGCGELVRMMDGEAWMGVVEGGCESRELWRVFCSRG